MTGVAPAARFAGALALSPDRVSVADLAEAADVDLDEVDEALAELDREYAPGGRRLSSSASPAGSYWRPTRSPRMPRGACSQSRVRPR